MKRVFIAVAAAILTFTAVYGFAASLTVTSTAGLGAGTTAVAACQAGTFNISSYSPAAYSATTPGYTVTTVTVSGLTSTCYTLPYRLTLTGAANASLGEATGTTPSAGSTFTATFSTPVNAASVTGAALVIGG